ncbi:HAD family hydrolase [Metasolibacillus sp. FSL K6-0083]|uniref:HAD family hydrolase n=1 Tax=Metasolibacillus sp. FSL K6-0083 TaxID=2921416 RepID=UPI003159F6D6
MKYVIVFDMDDTLYDELTYVQSGFRAVAEYLKNLTSVDKDELYSFMWERLLQNGRGRIFNDVLLAYSGQIDEHLLRKCIEVYREHEPNIQLPRQSVQILEKFKEHALYIVTDGDVGVQEKKIKALGLNNYVKEAIASYKKGVDKGKPSPYWFNYIAKNEEVEPQQIVYIGDNANKDFVGINRLGFRTIRVKQGQYVKDVPSTLHEAEVVIENLTDLPNALKKIWTNFITEGD